MDHRESGKRAAIWVKIMIDMPLPIPCSVTSSPIHMTIVVPAVIVRIMTMISKIEVEYTTGRAQPVNRRPEVARVTKAVACSRPSTRVR